MQVLLLLGEQLKTEPDWKDYTNTNMVDMMARCQVGGSACLLLSQCAYAHV